MADQNLDIDIHDFRLDFDPRLQLPDYNLTYMHHQYGLLDLYDDEWNDITIPNQSIEDPENEPEADFDENVSIRPFFLKLKCDPQNIDHNINTWVKEWNTQPCDSIISDLEKFLD